MVETRHRTCCRVFPSVAEFCRSRRCVVDRSIQTPYSSVSPPPLKQQYSIDKIQSNNQRMLLVSSRCILWSYFYFNCRLMEYYNFFRCSLWYFIVSILSWLLKYFPGQYLFSSSYTFIHCCTNIVYIYSYILYYGVNSPCRFLNISLLAFSLNIR